MSRRTLIEPPTGLELAVPPMPELAESGHLAPRTAPIAWP